MSNKYVRVMLLLFIGIVIYTFAYWIVNNYFSQYNVDKIMYISGSVLTFILLTISLILPSLRKR